MVDCHQYDNLWGNCHTQSSLRKSHMSNCYIEVISTMVRSVISFPELPEVLFGFEGQNGVSVN